MAKRLILLTVLLALPALAQYAKRDTWQETLRLALEARFAQQKPDFTAGAGGTGD